MLRAFCACASVAFALLGAGCQLGESCAPIDEPDSPEGDTLHVRFDDFEFEPGRWRVTIAADRSVSCEAVLPDDGEEHPCSEGAHVTADDEVIHNIHVQAYSPETFVVRLERDGDIVEEQSFSPAYDDMGHCSNALHAVVYFDSSDG